MNELGSSTTTASERLVMMASSAAALVMLILGQGWLALVVFTPTLGVAVRQQGRENRARRAATRELELSLPAMCEEDRKVALERFHRRFPAWAANRRLRALDASLVSPQRDALHGPLDKGVPRVEAAPSLWITLAACPALVAALLLGAGTIGGYENEELRAIAVIAGLVTASGEWFVLGRGRDSRQTIRTSLLAGTIAVALCLLASVYRL